MTIRVVLSGQAQQPLPQPPGRILLVHADHAFVDLAEAIDTGFARWDLTPFHRFDVEGRVLLTPGSAADEGQEAEDSDEVTVGEVGLRAGARFNYTFDLDEQWAHECTVEEVGVDPFALAGEEPEVPVPFFGWGVIPDQYGRVTEDDDDDLDDEFEDEDVPGLGESVELTAWDASEVSSWKVVEHALANVQRSVDAQALRAATADLRGHLNDEDPPYGVLWAAADLDEAGLPDNDEQCWLELAAAVVAPRDDVGLDVEAVAAWAALEPADWAGAVVELVRAGVGTPATPENLVALIAACPEIEDEDLTAEDQAVLTQGLETVVTLWTALGALDADGRLTPLGHWGLPEALRLAWSEN